MVNDLHTIAPNVITIRSDWDIIGVRMAARDMARRIGFGTIDQARIATVASELARHVVVEGIEVSLTICYAERGTWGGIELLLEEHGLASAGGNGASPSVPEHTNGSSNGDGSDGSSNGHNDHMNLKAIRRLIDEMETGIASGTGITVVCRKWLRS